MVEYPVTFEEKSRHVKVLLEGIQLVAAAEAIALASNIGLDARQLYSIICGAAGNSRMFETGVLKMLGLEKNLSSKESQLDQTIQELDNTLKLARCHKVKFGAPLASTALQLFTYASAAGFGDQDDSAVFKIWNAKPFEVAIPQDIIRESLPLFKHKNVTVAFIGLGTMGKGMALALNEKGYNVIGYDNYAHCAQAFVDTGGKAAKSVAEAVDGADIVIFMTVSLEQAESALLDQVVLENLCPRASIMLCLTAPPSGIQSLRKKLDNIRPDLDLIDAPVSGGEARAANGTLTITASSSPSDNNKTGLELVLPLLQIMAESDGKVGERLFLYPNNIGQGSRIKMINQLLAGVHVAASAETISFAKVLGMNDDELVRVHKYLENNGAGFMFNNRMGRVVRKDTAVESKMEIFYKDLSIVVDEASNAITPVPLAALALTKFTDAIRRGWAKDDDGTVIRLWNNFSLSYLKQ